METIFMSIFTYVAGSTLSGITWDVIKGSGEKVIDSFKTKFKDKSYFKCDDEYEKFLKIIFEKQSNSKKRPFNDLKTEFEEFTDIDYSNEVEKIFSEWILENESFLRKSKENSINQSGVININGQQNASSGGTIYNIANQVKY